METKTIKPLQEIEPIKDYFRTYGADADPIMWFRDVKNIYTGLSILISELDAAIENKDDIKKERLINAITDYGSIDSVELVNQIFRMDTILNLFEGIVRYLEENEKEMREVMK